MSSIVLMRFVHFCNTSELKRIPIILKHSLHA